MSRTTPENGLPSIIIEHGIDITHSQVAALYLQSLDAFNQFPDFCPPSEAYVSQIIFSNAGIRRRLPTKKGMRVLPIHGEFYIAPKKIIIYPRNLPEDGSRTWEQTLGHELGHSLHQQLLTASCSAVTRNEAIAEAISIIINCSGDISQVHEYLRALLTEHNRLFLGPIRMFGSYSTQMERTQDAAQMMYLAQLHGMHAVVDSVHAGVFNPVILPEHPSQPELLYQTRAEMVNRELQRQFGLTRQDLHAQSQSWINTSTA